MVAQGFARRAQPLDPRWMYARKQLDASFRDLLAAFAFTLRWDLKREQLDARLRQLWSAEDDALAALSVRTTFDAFLSEMALPHGSEVIMTGINIPDMVAIVQHHGLVVVPVDLDIATLEVNAVQLRRALTPRTRLVVAAHLYGARMDMERVFEALAGRPDIHVVEDCAQAFRGCSDYLGDARSAISMFSFGAIKTATSFGGAMARVRCPRLREAMRRRLSEYPAQGRLQFFRRAAKFALLKLVAGRVLYGCFVRLCRLAGSSHDEWVIAAVRNFKGGDLVARLRQQPAVPQLALLERRLSQSNNGFLHGRIAAGEFMRRQLAGVVDVPGAANALNSFWLFPVCSADKNRLVARLREGGFDATCSSTQLRAIRSDREIAGAPRQCIECIENTVYLPVYAQVPRRALERLAAILKENAATAKALEPTELAEESDEAVELSEAAR